MAPHATSSGSLAAGTNLVSPMAGALTYIQIVAAAAAATVTCYDSPDGTASGLIISSLTIAPNTGYASSLDFPVCYNKTLVVVVTGAGATGLVHFLPGA